MCEEESPSMYFCKVKASFFFFSSIISVARDRNFRALSAFASRICQVYANGEAKGMATKARIAMYKICWKFGCFDSDILAAMDPAIADGVHVISLSVGANGYAPPFDHDSIAIGAFGEAQHDVLVSCSAGNSGPDPFTAVNIVPWILTVGDSTIDREFLADVVLGNDRIFRGISLYSGDPLVDFKFRLVYAGDCGSRYCYAGSLQPSKVNGKIVVCDREGNTRVDYHVFSIGNDERRS